MTNEFEITRNDDNVFEAKLLKEFEVNHCEDIDAAIAQDERAYEALCAAARDAGLEPTDAEFEAGTGVDLYFQDQYAKAYELNFVPAWRSE